MKRLLTLFIVSIAVFSLVSCNEKQKNDNNDKENITSSVSDSSSQQDDSSNEDNTSNNDDSSHEDDEGTVSDDEISVDNPKSKILYKADVKPEPIMIENEMNIQIIDIFEYENTLYIDYLITSGYDGELWGIMFEGDTLCDSKGNEIAWHRFNEFAHETFVKNQTFEWRERFTSDCYDLSKGDLEDIKNGDVQLLYNIVPYFN